MNSLASISLRKFIAYKIKRAICKRLKHEYTFRVVGVTLPNSDTEINIETVVCTRCKDIDPAWEEHSYKEVKKLFLQKNALAY